MSDKFTAKFLATNVNLTVWSGALIINMFFFLALLRGPCCLCLIEYIWQNTKLTINKYLIFYDIFWTCRIALLYHSKLHGYCYSKQVVKVSFPNSLKHEWMSWFLWNMDEDIKPRSRECSTITYCLWPECMYKCVALHG